MTEQNPQALPKRMETIAAYIFQNENLLQEALIMHHKSNTQPHHKGHARLSNTGPFRNMYVTDDGFLIADNTSDLYINEGERCTYCNNWYETRALNINCHLVTKLTENTSKLWIDLYNHIIPIVEAYHHAGAGIALPTATIPAHNRRESSAVSLLYDKAELGNMIRWFRRSEKGSPEGEERRLINYLLFTHGIALDNYGSVIDIEGADAEIECTVCGAARASRGASVECCTADKLASSTHPAWIKAHNALLNIAEHYHAFTNGQNAAPMDTPTAEKESPNAEAVEAPESKTTTTYICGRCDTEHTSMTSAAMCCPDVDVSYTCNECNTMHDTRAAADYCCSSIETKHKHPDDPVLMLYACRTCGTITFDGAINNAQKIAADQHCNPMIEK